MRKHEEKPGQKSPAKPDSITKDADLSEDQLKEVSGGHSNCASGVHYKSVSLSMRKSGGDPT